MNKVFTILIALGITAALLSFTIYHRTHSNISKDTKKQNVATCYGYKNCNACKNCKYCKHCAKDGGTCGVCK